MPAEPEPQPAARAGTTIERRLRENLGVQQILWLGEGIVGDDTDGHVDDLTRFVAEDTVVTVVEQDPADENYQPLRENRERLAGMHLPDGRPLKVIELPMPEPLHRGEERLPASYANFYVGNRVVLLPVFGCPQDEEAAAILSLVLPRPARGGRGLPRYRRRPRYPALPDAAGSRGLSG